MLIAFEGIDGAGKSTQTALLAEWLEATTGVAPLVTKWNSSPLIKPFLKEAKKQRALTPIVFALLEAADLADRLNGEISGALAADKIVIADRWVYTAFARGRARGLSPSWVAELYSFVPKPDLCFYLDVPVRIALARIREFRPVKHYEAGMDMGLSKNLDKSFCKFQGAGADAYARMSRSGAFTFIDALTNVEAQQEIIRAAVDARLQARKRRKK